jgi:hypothetical protein
MSKLSVISALLLSLAAGGAAGRVGAQAPVFAGGLTNVRTVITVTDTQAHLVKTYTNPQGTAFQPIQDINAFATCP